MTEAAQLTTEEVAALRERAWRSPVEFGRLFLPEWFSSKMPWVHRGLLALITGKTEFLLDFGTEVWPKETATWTPADLQKILTNFITEEGEPLFRLDLEGERPVIHIEMKKDKHAFIMPRGYSKTTLMNLANLINICYKAKDFLMYLSETVTHASEQLSTIKKELEENELLRLCFGDLVAGRQSSNKWTEVVIEPTNGTRVAVVGRGGQVRGKNKGAKRPKLMIFDDLQDEETVENDEQLKKDAKWFFRAAEPALAKGGKIFVIGTLLAGGDGPILNKLLENEDYACVRFSGIDRQGEALWASEFGNGFSLAQLAHKRKIALQMGQLEGYYLEYESRYVSDDDKVFPRSKMIRVSKSMERFVAISLVVDPAIGEKKKSDFCAFAVVGIEAGGVKHVIHTEGKRAMPFEEQVDKFFELHFRFLAHLPLEMQRHGVEAVAYQKALQSTIVSQMFRRSREIITTPSPITGQVAGTRAYFEVEPITHGKTGKDERIKGILKPIYHSGYLTFERVFADLETQLFDYPTGNDDFPDVLAMAIKQLDPFASLGATTEEDFSKPAEPLPHDFGRFAS